MSNEKRSYYTKDFTKKDFYTAVKMICDGEDIADEIIERVAGAAEYELEGIANRPASKSSGTGEKKDPLQSEYACSLRSALVPFLTKKPQTLKDLIDQATAAGKVAPSGKPFSVPWAARVLNAEPGVVQSKMVVESVDSKGLKAQKEVTGYMRE